MGQDRSGYLFMHCLFSILQGPCHFPLKAGQGQEDKMSLQRAQSWEVWGGSTHMGLRLAGPLGHGPEKQAGATRNQAVGFTRKCFVCILETWSSHGRGHSFQS